LKISHYFLVNKLFQETPRQISKNYHRKLMLMLAAPQIDDKRPVDVMGTSCKPSTF